jgi:hypothetical protein
MMKKEAKAEEPANVPQGQTNASPPRENKFELMMYQLVLIVIVGMLVTLGIGYFVGKEVGIARAVNLMDINAPDYCLTEVKGSNINVRCSEMNMTLDEMCGYISPAMKSRIRIMLVTGK